MTLSMKADIKERWIEALESGEYEQGSGELHVLGYDIPSMGEARPDKFCCAGVLCHLAVQDGVVETGEGEPGCAVAYDGEFAYLPDSVIRWAGLSYEGERVEPDGAFDGGEESRLVLEAGDGRGGFVSLVQMNDSKETFVTIAGAIRQDVVGI